MLFTAINTLAFLCGTSWMMDATVADIAMRPLVVIGIVALMSHRQSSQ
jgi:hypothetical protein